MSDLGHLYKHLHKSTSNTAAADNLNFKPCFKVSKTRERKYICIDQHLLHWQLLKLNLKSISGLARTFWFFPPPCFGCTTVNRTVHLTRPVLLENTHYLPSGQLNPIHISPAKHLTQLLQPGGELTSHLDHSPSPSGLITLWHNPMFKSKQQSVLRNPTSIGYESDPIYQTTAHFRTITKSGT